jgi:flagellar protein FlgJ
MTKEELYVTKYYPLAVAAGEMFQLNPLVILAQGAFESGWGTSTLAKTYNNFFGITAAGSPNAFWDGKSYQATNQYRLKFRVYNNPDDSFRDFARLIAAKYKAAHAVNQDYKAYAQKIAYSPYISESNGDNRENYRKGIIRLYETIENVAKKKGLLLPPESPSLVV